MPLTDILDRTFQANPSYELLSLESLTPEEQELVGDLRDEASCFGVLRPRQGALGSTKAICRETALLWQAMNRSGPLPRWVLEVQRENANTLVAQLVLDGVLAMEVGTSFVTGPAARATVYGGSPAGLPQPDGALAQLSRRALQYAQSLGSIAPSTLSARLYQYGRLPLTPNWLRRFPSTASLKNELSIGAEWREVAHEGWLAWRSRIAPGGARERLVGYKLYLSPRPEHFVDAVRALADVGAGHGVSQFKVALDASGLLRPDKIVAYFSDRTSLDATADAVARTLQGYAVHGVPFTAELAGQGLLSWGIDPSPMGEDGSWHRGESWRLWVTNRLAVALAAAARSPGLDSEPWEFALDRIRLEGVDPLTWTPAGAGVGSEPGDPFQQDS
jgi:hypothetical protein